MKNREIKFRAWIQSENFMAIQGTPDLETLQSFMYHYGDEENLMQFTGLKDKNGIDIYENDLIQFHTNENILQVIYENGGFRLAELTGKVSVYNIKPECIEVIGNIHENPELIEPK